MQRLRTDRPLLPVIRSMSDVSLPAGDVSSCDDSSTDSYWVSPKSSSVRLAHDADGDHSKYSLPTWSVYPQSPGSATNGPVRSLSGTASLLITNYPRRVQSVLVLLGVTVMCFVAVIAPRVTLNRAADQIATFHSHRDDLQRRLTKYERDIQDIEHQLNTMDFDFNQQHLGFIAASSESTNSNGELHNQNLSEMHELQHRLKNELEQAQRLKSLVQAVSRNATIEKFGRSEHYVEFELMFPDEDGNHSDEGPNRFIIEMASIDLMPHSVNTFLEMVSIGLMDGCSFILNALQVVKAAPLPYDGTSASDKAKEFSKHGLESVSFKEYSNEYPHKMYTVGFAADGSPSFYINTADNSEIHVGDPCFGKVISGLETIHRLANSPTRNGIWFQHRIGIKAARIIPASAIPVP